MNKTVNNGICVQYIKNNEVLANCYYENMNTVVEALNILKSLMNGYNNLNLEEYDDVIEAVKFFENESAQDDFVGVCAKLHKDSLEDLLEEYDDIRFNKRDWEGLIGINDSDKEYNETCARIIVMLYIDERKVDIEDYEISKEFLEKYAADNPDIDIDSLDCFEWDLRSFDLIDLEEILQFVEEHNKNTSIEKAFFKMSNDEKFLYTFSALDKRR